MGNVTLSLRAGLNSLTPPGTGSEPLGDSSTSQSLPALMAGLGMGWTSRPLPTQDLGIFDPSLSFERKNCPFRESQSSVPMPGSFPAGLCSSKPPSREELSQTRLGSEQLMQGGGSCAPNPLPSTRSSLFPAPSPWECWHCWISASHEAHGARGQGNGPANIPGTVLGWGRAFQNPALAGKVTLALLCLSLSSCSSGH